MAFKNKRLWQRCVLCQKIGKKICNSNLPLYFIPGRRKAKKWKGKKKKKTRRNSVYGKAAGVSWSPSTVASGASACDWSAPADSAGCAAAGECQEKRNSCLIIPAKCGAAGDTATRGLRNHVFCHLYSFCMFLGCFFWGRRNKRKVTYGPEVRDGGFFFPKVYFSYRCRSTRN